MSNENERNLKWNRILSTSRNKKRIFATLLILSLTVPIIQILHGPFNVDASGTGTVVSVSPSSVGPVAVNSFFDVFVRVDNINQRVVAYSGTLLYNTLVLTATAADAEYASPAGGICAAGCEDITAETITDALGQVTWEVALTTAVFQGPSGGMVKITFRVDTKGTSALTPTTDLLDDTFSSIPHKDVAGTFFVNPPEVHDVGINAFRVNGATVGQSVKITQGGTVTCDFSVDNHSNVAQEVIVSCFIGTVNVAKSSPFTIQPGAKVPVTVTGSTAGIATGTYQTRGTVSFTQTKTDANPADNQRDGPSVTVNVPMVHDVAINSVSTVPAPDATGKVSVQSGAVVKLVVSVDNLGTQAQEVIVRVIITGTTPGSGTTCAAQGTALVGVKNQFSCTWATSGFPKDSYSSFAEVVFVESAKADENPTNNRLPGPTINVLPFHDVGINSVKTLPPRDPTTGQVTIKEKEPVEFTISVDNHGNQDQAVIVHVDVSAVGLGIPAIQVCKAFGIVPALGKASFTCTWNTTGFLIAKYSTLATVAFQEHKDDKNPNNNTMDGPSVTITKHFDIAVQQFIVNTPDPLTGDCPKSDFENLVVQSGDTVCFVVEIVNDGNNKVIVNARFFVSSAPLNIDSITNIKGYLPDGTPIRVLKTEHPNVIQVNNTPKPKDPSDPNYFNEHPSLGGHSKLRIRFDWSAGNWPYNDVKDKGKFYTLVYVELKMSDTPTTNPDGTPISKGPDQDPNNNIMPGRSITILPRHDVGIDSAQGISVVPQPDPTTGQVVVQSSQTVTFTFSVINFGNRQDIVAGIVVRSLGKPDTVVCHTNIFAIDPGKKALVICVWDTRGFPKQKYQTVAFVAFNDATKLDEDPTNNFLDGPSVTVLPFHDVGINNFTVNGVSGASGAVEVQSTDPVRFDVSFNNFGNQEQNVLVSIWVCDWGLYGANACLGSGSGQKAFPWINIAKKVHTVLPGEKLTRTFLWDTTNVAKSSYFSSASIEFYPPDGSKVDKDPLDNWVQGPKLVIGPFHDVGINFFVVNGASGGLEVKVQSGDNVEFTVSIDNNGNEKQDVQLSIWLCDVTVQPSICFTVQKPAPPWMNIAKKVHTLQPGEKIVQTFVLDTSTLAKGTYLTSASVDFFPPKVDKRPEDNWVPGPKLTINPFHDVGVLSFDVKPTKVEVGHNVEFNLNFTNFGNQKQDVIVSIWVCNWQLYTECFTIQKPAFPWLNIFKKTHSLQPGEQVFQRTTITIDMAGSFLTSATIQFLETGKIDKRPSDNWVPGPKLVVNPIQVHDVGINAVTATPAGSVQSGGLVTFAISVDNFGTQEQNVTVSIILSSPGKPSVNVCKATGLALVGVKNIFNCSWDTTGFAKQKYDTLATVDFFPPKTDSNPANNQLPGPSITVLPFHDVGINSVTTMPAPDPLTGQVTVQSSQTVKFIVSVDNNGNQAQNVTVQIFVLPSLRVPPPQLVCSASGIVPASTKTSFTCKWDTAGFAKDKWSTFAEVRFADTTKTDKDPNNNHEDGPSVTVLPFHDVGINLFTVNGVETGQIEIQSGQQLSFMVSFDNLGNQVQNVTTSVWIVDPSGNAINVLGTLGKTPYPISPGAKVQFIIEFVPTSDLPKGKYLTYATIELVDGKVDKNPGNNRRDGPSISITPFHDVAVNHFGIEVPNPVPLYDSQGNLIGFLTHVVHIVNGGTSEGMLTTGGIDTLDTSALIELEVPGVGSAQESCSGPAMIQRLPALDTDGDGTLDTIPIELVSLDLTCKGGLLGTIHVIESPTLQSLGRIMSTNPSQGLLPADSFFDVFVEIATPMGTLHNTDPVRLQANIEAIPPIGAHYQPPSTVKSGKVSVQSTAKVPFIIGVENNGNQKQTVIVRVFASSPGKPDILACETSGPVQPSSKTLFRCNWDTTGVPKQTYVTRAEVGFADLKEDKVPGNNRMTGPSVNITPFHDVGIQNFEVKPTKISVGEAAEFNVQFTNFGNQKQEVLVSIWVCDVTIQPSICFTVQKPAPPWQNIYKKTHILQPGETVQQRISIVFDQPGSFLTSATIDFLETGKIDKRPSDNWVPGPKLVVNPIEVHDVGINAVTATPAGSVQSGGLVTFAISVDNFGTQDQDVTVSVIVSSPGKAPVTVCKVTGVALVGVKNIFNCSWDTTGFAKQKYDTLATVDFFPPKTDSNPANNQLPGPSITVLPFHDVGINSITTNPPPGSTGQVEVQSGDSVTFVVSVDNNGNQDQDVVLSVLVFSSGKNPVNLCKVTGPAIAGVKNTFVCIWETTGFEKQKYQTLATVDFPPPKEDKLPDNNHMAGPSISVTPFHDVGINRFTVNGVETGQIEIQSGQQLSFEVSFDNHGNQVQNVTNSIFIVDPSGNAINILGTLGKTPHPIAPGAKIRFIIEFFPTADLPKGKYLTYATIEFSDDKIDKNPADNRRDGPSIDITPFHDVGINSVVADPAPGPAGQVTVQSGSRVKFTVSVDNNGNQVQSVTVRMLATDSSGNVRELCSPAAGDVDTHSKTSFTCTWDTTGFEPKGKYSTTAEVFFTDSSKVDKDPTNNHMAGPSVNILPFHDVGINSVTTNPPPGPSGQVTITAGLPVVFIASVDNNGNQDQSVIVHVFIVTPDGTSVQVCKAQGIVPAGGKLSGLTCFWNTSGFVKGKYSTSAVVELTDEQKLDKDPSNNRRAGPSVTILAAPLAASLALPKVAYETEPTSFTISISGGSPSFTCNVDFGDLTTQVITPCVNGQVVTHTYASAATYTITVTVTDANGAMTTVSQPIPVQPEPRFFQGKLSWKHHLTVVVQTFSAKITNPSNHTVDVTVIIAITKPDGTVDTAMGTFTLAPGASNTNAIITYNTAMLGKYTFTATLTYQSVQPDGTVDLTGTGPNSKTGSFNRV